jgi:tRNA (adenine22-N1)-methyltransferase
MIKLSPRLKKITDLVNDNSKVIDIGCDHGLVDVYISKNKKNITVLASDINQNALNNAIENIKKYHCENNVSTILSDGLNQIDTTNYDTIIISGMGAHSIIGILQTNKNKLKNIDTLIIQSNNDIDFLRKKITDMNYYIEQEELVKEKKFIYTIIRFKKGRKKYTKQQLYFGPILLIKNDDLFKEKNRIELSKLKILYQLIPKSHYRLKIKTYLKIRRYRNI